jgi:NnrS protein
LVVGMSAEPPVYRPFALLAFAATLAAGTPLGFAMLAWLYAHGPAVSFETRLLHAHLQIFGFFATLIVGVAPHLVARFTGRPTTRLPAARPIALLLGSGLVLRIAGASVPSTAMLVAAGAAQTLAFALFATWLSRALNAPPLALVRRHLLVATTWILGGLALEVALRAAAIVMGVPAPGAAGVHLAQTMALVGGVLGWMLGVLLRAGPMFVVGWRVPTGAARAVPITLALAIVASGAAETGLVSASGREVLARLGDALATGTLVAIAALAGAWRSPRATLPMLARSPAEKRLFLVALASAGVATAASALGAGAGLVGYAVPLLGDAVRHLLTVGVMGGIVVAMTFRLIPVLEAAPLPWPWLRTLAFAALVGSVALRSAEVLVGAGTTALAPLVALSGPLAWLAFAAPAANLAAILARRGGALSPGTQAD